MDVFALFATDEAAEVEGRWFPLSKTARVKVARTGNERYVNALRQRMKENQIDPSDESKETNDLVLKLIVETMAETILLDFEGMKYKGADLPYTYDNAVLLLSVKDFRKRISDIADKAESFRLKAEEEQGNA